MTFRKLVLVFGSLGLLMSTTVNAAQTALVTSRRAPIYEKPADDSPILEYADPGDKLRISSHHKEGFYKVKTKGAGYGWIWQAHVAIDQNDPNIKVADLEMSNQNHEHRFERGKRNFIVRGSGFLFSLRSSDISNRLDYKGAMAHYPSYGGFFDVGVGITDGLRVIGRVGYYSGAGSASKNSISYDVTHSAIPVLLGLEGDVYRGKRFDISSGVFAGVGLQSSTTVTAASASAPNSFSIQGTAIAALGNFAFKYALGTRFSVVTELGAIFLQRKAQNISTDFNGSDVFKNSDTGLLGQFRVRHIGPYLGLGLQLGL